MQKQRERTIGSAPAAIINPKNIRTQVTLGTVHRSLLFLMQKYDG